MPEDSGNGAPRDGYVLPELFEAQARRTPDTLAVVSASTRLSYAQLNFLANRLAHELIARGVGPEQVVGLVLAPAEPLVVALLAILKAGAAYLPIDLDSPAERIAFMLSDARPALVLTDTASARAVPGLGRHLILDDEQLAQTLRDRPAVDPVDADRDCPLTPRNAAYVIYTSGSTGRPKGVTIEHRSVANYVMWSARAYPSVRGSALLHTSIAVDLTVTSLYAPLISGGIVELAPLRHDGRASAYREVTFLKATPSHLPLLTVLPRSVSPSGDIVLGGEQLFGETLAAWRRLHTGTAVVNEYGPTEVTVGCATFRIPPFHPVPGGVLPIGQPIEGTRMYVLDAALRPAPPGMAGELFASGVQVARGYCGRPALTAERFLPDPFGPPGDRMYRTGDIARTRDDGNLEFLGRIDDQVKIQGFRVELGEIEAVLAEQPGVDRAAVVVRGDRPEDKELVAYVMSRGHRADGAELRIRAARMLPAYMVPVAVVVLESLPLTPAGKVDRQALPAPDLGRIARLRAAGSRAAGWPASK